MTLIRRPLDGHYLNAMPRRFRRKLRRRLTLNEQRVARMREPQKAWSEPPIESLEKRRTPILTTRGGKLRLEIRVHVPKAADHCK